ncbi:MAG TPA: class I SAM-dependent methyltransferase [Burkholderiaceae bacterium]|nr:class I SAM-dependent methyltransferase [Burkholderiaceae bacterium]
MNMPTDARQLYDQTATNWSRQQPTSLSDYTARPRVIAMCEPLEGKKVLDLGCGEGYVSRMLRNRGAHVIGLDVSERMIALARQAEEARPLGIRYDTADAVTADLGDASVDLVVAVFLFNYLDVERMRKTMRNVHRMLRPGGHFVFAVPHPAFAFMREAAPPFYFGVGAAGYFSARDSLFSGRIWKRDGSALDVQLVHKTFEDYFEGLRAAGFTAMPSVNELAVTRDMIDLDEGFFGPLYDLPLHLAVKVARA